MHKSKGFILVSLLIILQILALLGWYTIQNTILHLRASHNDFQRHSIEVSAEDRLNFIENQALQEAPTCLTPITTLSALKMHTLDWWQSKAVCHAVNFLYHFDYIFENLGENPCSLIQNPGTIAQYLRITLKTTDPLHETTLFLQSIIAKPVHSSDPCLEQQEIILPGRQSWIKS
ncbi:MAG: hypothetical protein SFW66_02405 [Gammaproteobacteria bacterium]|nr:hypothetical protein [Gammaproteobacteria bacterium]